MKEFFNRANLARGLKRAGPHFVPVAAGMMALLLVVVAVLSRLLVKMFIFGKH